MAIDRRVLEAARDVGGREGVAPAALVAVALVETRGVPFVEVKGANEPLIRFEGHYFDRLLPDALRAKARAAGLSHPRAGRIANPPGQSGRWALYEAARALDAEAAAASVSWGLCQVMGLHGKTLGFGSAVELAEAARASIPGQMSIGARFLAHGHLGARLMEGDVKGFARRYNGPAYGKNHYDEKIAAALKRAKNALAQAGDYLSIGDEGDAVLRLQMALRNVGSPIVLDGIFGPRTHEALTVWQTAAGLAPSGIADEATRLRLRL
ncbi:MAG: DUF3380 domain-containing protein [Fulvimarina manganoxydans]|uniref:N-acetylmuramidase domain-containing protein n=1 Tax=Fulvimarina manganoxydans TaxID=937218 RepID=UPI002354B6B8|nr:N-acetylmuramidase domain-containing protein [Fulvimarina manganoxydans]MCK5932861.1 DUF3380 domain-containing protein [Fulvimarina manganoxydans]